MKLIKKIFDSQRKHFSETGNLKALKPLFDAFETFFFIPAITAQQTPYIRDSIDLKRFMSIVILALLPPFIYGVYNTGHQSILAQGLPLDLPVILIRGFEIILPVIIVSYAVGFFWEVLFASIRKHNISEGFLVTGLLFPLTLPPTIPLWQVAVGISFGVVIGKEVFGGTGRNIFNPALTGRAFLFFAYPASMSGDSVWVAASRIGQQTVDTITGATPLACTFLTQPGDSLESILKDAGFTFKTLFMGGYPGSIGGTSTLCCMIGAAILILTGIASYKIIFGGVAGLLASSAALIFFSGPQSHPFLSLNPFFHLVMGGFAFGIVYMATDPVSAPGMEKSKWIYGFAIGVLTVLIRVYNPAYPEGVMMAILFMNLFSPLLDHIEIKMRLNKRVPNV